MTKKTNKVTVCVNIEYGEEIARPHYITDERGAAFKALDIYAAGQMKLRPNETTRITFMEVVHIINF